MPSADPLISRLINFNVRNCQFIRLSPVPGNQEMYEP